MLIRNRRRSPGRRAALRSGQAQARAILDASLDAVITIDHLGRVLEFNRAAEETFGYRREHVLGHELAALVVPPESREECQLALARLGGGNTRRRRAARPPARAAGHARRRLALPRGARHE